MKKSGLYIHNSFTYPISDNIYILYGCCLILSCFIFFGGCISDKVTENSPLITYQQKLNEFEPRVNEEIIEPNQPLDILKPVEISDAAKAEFFIDPNTGQRSVSLSIEQVIQKVLTNSPEIRVISFDPSIAKLDITKAASEFDITAFSDLNYEDEDNPANSIYQPGQSNSRAFDTGIRQKIPGGAEWSLTYALTRNWDDLSGRTLSTRYEPILSFQLRQPLLRDSLLEANLAGIDIARLNYKIALLGFRQRTENITTEVIATYWRLFQARHDLEVYQNLLNDTLETLNKVQSRRQIDATEVHIQQTLARVKSREAALIQAKRQITDQKDILVRLMADSQLNLLEEFDIITSSKPLIDKDDFDISKLLETTLKNNPVIQQAKAQIEIAQTNILIAQNRKMPRLDLVTSARTQSLAAGPENAHDRLSNGDYVSYAVGLSLEYPLGNRQRQAELMQRRYARRQAVAGMENVVDEAAQLTKEKVRSIETNYFEIEKQQEAVEAAATYLEVLEESEIIRDKLTPEFILLKLEAQQFLASAQVAHMRAIIEYNISLAELSRILGTVLTLYIVDEIEDSNSIVE